MEDDDSGFDEFDAAFVQLRQWRNLRRGRPTKRQRDDLIVKLVRWSVRAGLPIWFDDNKAAKGSPKRTAFTVAAAKLRDYYGICMSANAIKVAYFRHRQRRRKEGRRAREVAPAVAVKRARIEAIKRQFEAW